MSFKNNRQLWAWVCGLVIIGAGSVAWQNHNSNANVQNSPLDTIPKKEQQSKKQKTVITGDLDKTLKQLDEAAENLEKQWNGNKWQKEQQALQQSLQKLQAEKIEQEIEQAMKNIDLEKIKIETQEQLQKIDWKKMQAEIEASVADIKNNIDSKKLAADIQQSLSAAKLSAEAMENFNADKIRAEVQASLQNLKDQKLEMKASLEKARKSMQENMGRDFEKEMKKARESLQTAKENLKAYKEMLQLMEQDGLLNTKENYKVEYKNGTLLINGKQQPQTVLDKYKKYFKTEPISIQKEGDEADDSIINF
jgi:chromosome segregation ATPase